MPRRLLLAAILTSAPAAAQQPPPTPTLPEPIDPFAAPKVEFRPFNGVSPDQFRQSAAGRAAARLVQELDALKLAAGNNPAVASRVEAASRAAAEFARLAAATPDRPQLDAAAAGLDTEVRAVFAAVGPSAALAPAVARVQYAQQQVVAALASGDDDPGRVAKAVARVAESLDEQADELRFQAEDQLPPAAFDADLRRAVRAVSRGAGKVRRAADAGPDLDPARRAFADVAKNWEAAAARLARTPAPPAVRAQAARVDGLYRRLGTMLGANAPAPQPPPQPAPPQPQPQPAPQPPRRDAVFAVAAGDTGGPAVAVYRGLQPQPSLRFFAYDQNYRGGVRVAVADMNGDGVPDIVTAPGRDHPPLVRVFDGRDASLLVEFLALDKAWTGGLTVAAADLTADGKALVAVAPDVGGGPTVKVFDLAQGKEVRSFAAFDERERGGLRLAMADVNGDGVPDVVAVPGQCANGPVVRVFSGADGGRLAEFACGDRRFTGGLFVAAAADGKTRRRLVAVAADQGGGPQTQVFDALTGRRVAVVDPYPADFLGGVRVGLADLDADGTPEVLTTPGAGIDAFAYGFRLRDGARIAEVHPLEGFRGGAFVTGR